MEKNNSSIATFGFVIILIFVRIVCDKIASIYYIIYAINILSLIYVVFQIENRLCNNTNSNSNSKIMRRRDKNIKTTMNKSIIVIISLAIIIIVMVKIFLTTTELGILNDSLALLTLAISIEDETVYCWINKMRS